MRKLLALLVFWGMAMGVSGQKEDYVWLSGYDSHVGYDSNWGFHFGTSVLDFNSSPRQVRYDSLKMNFDKTNTSFCDSNGNLLFYTNGIYISNALDEKIQNSDSLNPGYLQYEWAPSIQNYGYRSCNSIYTIPSLYSSNQYYLIHCLVDSFSYQLSGRKILVTLLDMSLNNGQGKVLYKNLVIVNDTISWSFAVSKHGNGRDWWALVQERNTNCYYRILVTETGVHTMPGLTCTGNVIPIDGGSVCFSPDGNKFVYLGIYGGLKIYDFDRCSGELSNSIELPLPIIDSLGWLGMGVAISPNNRFLYVSLTRHLYQFDLNAQDVLGSIDTVGIFDGTLAPFSALFNTAQNGPDGKIYISCGNADTVYHVIERPDEKGDSCLFRQHSLNLRSPSLSVPCFPNYRLGALAGSGCDTLTGLNEPARAAKEKEIKVFPNPAADYITIDYGFTDWSKGDVDLEITNGLGQAMHKQQLPKYSGFQKIDVSDLTSGVYVVSIKRKGQVVGAAKFGKE